MDRTHMVAVIDDTPQVWRYSPNLVAVAPYEYFLGMDEANLLSVNLKSKGKGDLPVLLWRCVRYCVRCSHPPTGGGRTCFHLLGMLMKLAVHE